MNEDDIIKGCLKQDRISQKTLYEKFYGRMMAVCMRYSKNTEEAKVAGELKKFLSLKLAREHYLIELDLVEEVVPPGRIFCIPRQKIFVRGVMNIKSGLVVIIDPAILLNIAEKEHQGKAGLILLKQGVESAPLGLLVDEMPGSIVFDTGLGQSQTAAVHEKDSGFFKGLFEKDGKPFVWIDIRAFANEVTRRLKT